MTQTQTCSYCGGQGVDTDTLGVPTQTCRPCRGTGRVAQEISRLRKMRTIILGSVLIWIIAFGMYLLDHKAIALFAVAFYCSFCVTMIYFSLPKEPR